MGVLPAHMSVHYMCAVPRTGVTHSCGLTCRYWESNPDPLGKWPVFLSAESSLQPEEKMVLRQDLNVSQAGFKLWRFHLHLLSAEIMCVLLCPAAPFMQSWGLKPRVCTFQMSALPYSWPVALKKGFTSGLITYHCIWNLKTHSSSTQHPLLSFTHVFHGVWV